MLLARTYVAMTLGWLRLLALATPPATKAHQCMHASGTPQAADGACISSMAVGRQLATKEAMRMLHARGTGAGGRASVDAPIAPAAQQRVQLHLLLLQGAQPAQAEPLLDELHLAERL